MPVWLGANSKSEIIEESLLDGSRVIAKYHTKITYPNTMPRDGIVLCWCESLIVAQFEIKIYEDSC